MCGGGPTGLVGGRRPAFAGPAAARGPDLGSFRVQIRKILPVGSHSQRPDFCSWQAGRKRIHTRLPDVLAVAGTPVLAFRKARTIGDYSFLDDRKAARKEEEPSSWWNRQGPSV